MSAFMGVFRSLSATDVTALLSAFGVHGYRQHAPISAGTINTNVAVETDTAKLFLRVNEGKARADVEQEASVLAHVAARGVPTPSPVRTPGGDPFVAWEDVFVSLFPWVDGRVLTRAEIQPLHGLAVGGALARLHRAGADFRDHRTGRYEPDEIQSRFERVAAESSADPALAGALGILGPELRTLARDRAPGLPLGLIHGDLFVDNVLFTGSGQLAALLDFEQASWGRLAYDVAVTLLAFGFGRDDFRADVTRAFLDGYRQERTPSPVEREAFGAELRFAACRFAVTRITDIYLRRSPGAPAGKDFRRYVQRLERVREHLAADDGLLAL